jgi:hypothetical protein
MKLSIASFLFAVTCTALNAQSDRHFAKSFSDNKKSADADTNLELLQLDFQSIEQDSIVYYGFTSEIDSLPQQKSAYVRDPQGNVVSITGFTWNASNGWVSTIQLSYDYDNTDHLSLITESISNSSESATYSEFEYENDVVISRANYTMENEAKLYISKELYDYQDGNLVSVIFLQWDQSVSNWSELNQTRYLYAYDLDGNLSSIQWDYRNSNEEEWQMDLRTEFEYNSQNQQTFEIQYRSVNGVLTNHTKAVSHYPDATFNQIDSAFVWLNDEWTLFQSGQYQLNENGDLIYGESRSSNTFWSEDSGWILGEMTTTKGTVSYDNNSRIHTEALWLWNDGQETWDLHSKNINYYPQSSKKVLSTLQQKNWNIYPNPSKDGIFRIGSEQPEDFRATIYDLSGSEIHRCIVQDGKLDLSHLNIGIYILTSPALKSPIKLVTNK